MSELVFRRAQVLCYRIFDVAEEIDLARASALLAADIRRLKLSREGSEYLELPNPPLTVALGRRPLGLKSGEVEVEIRARIFDHGALSIIVSVPVKPGTTIEALIPVVDDLFDAASLEALALEQIERLRPALQPAVSQPHLWKTNESYTVVFAEEIDGAPTASALLDVPELPRLMLGEAGLRSLSARERGDVLEHHYSYSDRDLVVIDWNCAFVYEPSGSMDIPDLLEIGNAQLLELRYYDDVLDEELKRNYDEVSVRKTRWYALFWSPYRVMARRVMATLLELSEFIERVENSLKIVGDFYLAKVYEGAVHQLRIPAWQAQVTRKQQLLSQTYQLLKGEVDTDRSVTLELTIVLLIISEILMAALQVLK